MCVRGKGAVVEVSVGVKVAAQTVQRQVGPMVSPFGSAARHRCACERTAVADAAGTFFGKAAARRAAARDVRADWMPQLTADIHGISRRSAHQGRWRLPCGRVGPDDLVDRHALGSLGLQRIFSAPLSATHRSGVHGTAAPAIYMPASTRVHAVKHAPPSNHGLIGGDATSAHCGRRIAHSYTNLMEPL